MPKVLVVVKGLGLGGAERLVAESIVCATERGSRYSYEAVYVLPWKDQLVERIGQAGTRVSCVGGPNGSLMQAAREIRLLSRRVDLVHAHLPATGIVSRLASAAPVIYTEHNIASSYRQPTRFFNRVTYRRNIAVTAVSDAVRESLTGYPGPEPVTIRNGVATEDVADARASVRGEFHVGDDEKLVVHVGNIRPHKGHHNLIRAVARLDRENSDIVVLSIGTEKHPGDIARLEELATSLGVSDRIRFLGRRDDAHRLIAGADLLVNPSDVEGLPVVILEAMKLGTPVVATDVGGVASVIRDGETGWLVPPLEPDSLACALEAALQDASARSSCVERAKTLVEAEYGIGRMVSELEELYDLILR